MRLDNKKYVAHGKLMLFGEYVVMRGLPALAFPTKFGQELRVSKSDSFSWRSFEGSKEWFSVDFNREFQMLSTNDKHTATKLLAVLSEIHAINSKLFLQPLSFEMVMDFDRSWGLGSSATFISLLGQWSGIDPYSLNEKYFNGSGYDIACAMAQKPIMFWKETREVMPFELPESITKYLVFVYSGAKQNSQKEVTKFSEIDVDQGQLNELNRLILEVPHMNGIDSFERVIDEHEARLSSILGVTTIKSSQFSNYPYSIKSLGAWGGDFFMATCRDIAAARDYFFNQGFPISLCYAELALKS